MLCPRDGTELATNHLHGIEVEHCHQCGGRWLDYDELSKLEASAVSDEDARRGMIEYSRRQSELACPVCSRPMVAFNYRANPLELDTCEEDHGWWLDAGEEKKVGDYIDQRVRDLYRAADAEASWGGFMQGLRKFRGRKPGR